LIQHKNEAKWFYRYLSIVYDTIVNPPHWNEDMRTDALEPAKLDKADLEVRGVLLETCWSLRHNLLISLQAMLDSNASSFGMRTQVVDVGGGTGFCTQGIVKHVRPQNVTLIDQSPDQLNKARQKADLQGVTIVEVGCDTIRGLSVHSAYILIWCNGASPAQSTCCVTFQTPASG
jgi:MPBQ/MSBQ methyltransferase